MHHGSHCDWAMPKKVADGLTVFGKSPSGIVIAPLLLLQLVNVGQSTEGIYKGRERTTILTTSVQKSTQVRLFSKMKAFFAALAVVSAPFVAAHCKSTIVDISSHWILMPFLQQTRSRTSSSTVGPSSLFWYFIADRFHLHRKHLRRQLRCDFVN